MENSNANTNNLIRSNGKSNFYVRSILISAFFIFLIINERFQTGIMSYVDEVIGILSFIFLLVQRKKVNKNDIINLVLLEIAIAIGLISNLVSELTSDWFSICVDVLASSKLLLAYFGMKYYSTNKEKQATINMLLPLAKLFTILAFIFSIASQFVDLGMTGGERYHIKSFRFFFRINFQYIAVYILVLGVLVFTTKLTPKKRKIYYAMAVVSIILATKAPALILAFLFVFLSIYYKRHKVLNPIVIIIISFVLIGIGWYQINNYLLREDVPRHLFWVYGVKTANNYFPLGSGFATFGSDQASRNYSQLYYQYGFDKQWGMSPDYGPYLSDNFWPTVIAQFGWIGGGIYILIFVILFFQIIGAKNLTPDKKAFLFAAYTQYMVHAIGSAILSSSAGVLGFMALAMFITSDINYTNQTKTKLRVKL